MSAESQAEISRFSDHMLNAYGVPSEVSRRLVRMAGTHHRWAERECNGDDWLIGDLVACPAAAAGSFNRQGFYIGDTVEGWCPECGGVAAHERVTRTQVASARLEASMVALLAPFDITPNFQGDPRGATVKLRVPDGYSDSWGGDGYCVPIARR